MNGPGAWPLVIDVIGWCLVHFVWQAALVAGIYAVARALVPRGDARYLLAMGALVALAALPIATGVHEYRELAVAGPASLAGPGATAALLVPTSRADPGWRVLLDHGLPWLVLAWAITATLLGARVVRQWLRLRAIVAAATPRPEWQLRAREYAARMGLRRVVPVLASVRIATPTLIGWLRPVVVLPLSVLTRMPPAQLDLVLAHELAHLKRFDHFANLFQVVLETLFFYHPAVRWISRDARNEREVCCDALALRATGGMPRDFIEALANLAELRAGRGALALAADGGVLVERAAFIAGVVPGSRRRSRAGGFAVALAVAALVIGGGAWWRHAVQQSANLASMAAASTVALTRNVVAQLVDVAAVPVLAPVASGRLAALPEAIVAAGGPTPHVPRARIDPGPVVPVAMPLQVPPIALTIAAWLPMAEADAPAIAPRPVRTVAPAYPPRAMVQGLEGEVEVEFRVSPGGVPEDLRVVRSAAGPLDAAALQALSEWRFVPVRGDPGRSFRQSFAFRLGAEGGSPGACLVLTGSHVCRSVDAAPAARPAAGLRRP